MSTPLAHVAKILDAALDAICLSPETCRTGRYLGGEVPWDECGDGGCSNKDGMLWAKLIGVNPVSGQSTSTKCADYLWTAEVGVVRCIAGVTTNGVPGMGLIEADANRQVTDADAIFTALTCGLAPDSLLADVELTSWSPLGPSGGCAGGAWTMRGRLSVCC